MVDSSCHDLPQTDAVRSCGIYHRQLISNPAKIDDGRDANELWGNGLIRIEDSYQVRRADRGDDVVVPGLRWSNRRMNSEELRVFARSPTWQGIVPFDTTSDVWQPPINALTAYGARRDPCAPPSLRAGRRGHSSCTAARNPARRRRFLCHLGRTAC